MDENHLERLAIFHHGALASLHALGAAHHLLQEDKGLRNWLCAGVHLGGLLFDAASVREHYKEVRSG